MTVYMAGKNQNLTKIGADIIEAEIIQKFSAVVKVEQSRSSLRILCKTQQQKELMLRGGSVAGVEATKEGKGFFASLSKQRTGLQ